MPWIRERLVPVLVLTLGLIAIAGIALLVRANGADRDAELKLSELQITLNQLESAPFQAAPALGGDPERARAQIAVQKASVNSALADLRRESAPAELDQVSQTLIANYATLDEIYELASTVGLVRGRVLKLVRTSGAQTAEITALLTAAGEEYHQRAERSRVEAIAGSAVIVLMLFGAFAFFYSRSKRLTDERARALVASRHEALTDPLTGLSNRRALLADLARQVPALAPGEELALALYDLDGFKIYNDSFGHAAGDSLLARLGDRLAAAAGKDGTAYRLGGDEFCLLVTGESVGDRAAVLARGAVALTESGQLFDVGCSYGAAVMPTEATKPDEALRLSDQRMYASKASRGTASRESTDVLLKVLDEQTVGLLHHVHDVAELAKMTGFELGLEPTEILTLERAAELHDIGKCAIPDAVLNKPGPLDAAEWEFIRQHTLVGERIVLAAPSLTETAPMIRSSHERVDGSGYPDGLSGAAIPLGARIIAVCDAYDAMTSARSYSEPLSSDRALAELDRCAGHQFDAAVVHAFRASLLRPGSALLGSARVPVG